MATSDNDCDMGITILVTQIWVEVVIKTFLTEMIVTWRCVIVCTERGKAYNCSTSHHTPSPQLDSWQSVTSWDTSLETKILCVFTVWRNSSVCYSSDWKEFSELKSEAAGGFYATFSCNFFMCFQANLSCKNQCWSHKIVLMVTHLSLHWSYHWLRLMQRSLRVMLNSFHPEAWWSVNWELFSEVSQHCNHQ